MEAFDADSLIKQELEALVALRRDLHENPELHFEERRTSQVVQRELSALGIPFRAGLARGTGVVAHLAPTDPANSAKPAIALRADMDALPILEKTGRTYASRNPGVMHACGHDGHTTILLGAARVLAKLEHRPNPVTFVFQPAEEGGGGGDLMCKDGALLGGPLSAGNPDDAKGGLGPPVARIYGLHGWPSVPLGVVTPRPGPLLASVDDFKVEVHGVGGHAAYPHLAKDPIVAAAHCITALQTIVSRHTGPLESSVLTVGQIYAGTANNIIPETATFIGTARTLTPKLRASLRKRFFEIVTGTAQSFGCSAAIEWHESYPVTLNDEHATAQFFEVAKKTLGAGRVRVAEHPTMGGEDFSYYAQHVPACFFLLGLRPEHATSYPGLHQPDFDFNDDAIETGVQMMVALALHG